MKGILLAGGKGTRLYPSTLVLSKQLLTVYDKPMVYYPLSTLMLAGIREILIVSAPRDLPQYRELLGDGTQYGLHLSYAVQDSPRGLADAFILGRDFIGDDSVCLVLGDNIFYGYGFSARLEAAASRTEGATVFGYHVSNPKDYGVVEFAPDGTVISIEEKPAHPKSEYAVPGLYFYDNRVVDIAAQIRPSARGELEITDIQNEYLRLGQLRVELFGRGMAWLDTGSHKSLLDAANFVETVQTRQGQYIACLEEIAWNKSFISREQLRSQGEKLKASDYGQYILRICEGGGSYA